MIAEVEGRMGWQRCRVRFRGDIFGEIELDLYEMVAATIRAIFPWTASVAVYAQLDLVADVLGRLLSRFKAMVRESAIGTPAFGPPVGPLEGRFGQPAHGGGG
ncbi:hypothetical protein [Streptomyces sp. NPDC017991]|uniref:hypothetical protein n=1 Tax=Streptomyces sp. NPDC017991 TaxID=3365026 RepID=UPI0037B8DC0E